MAPMTFGQKVEHIWSYYKIHFLLVLIFAVAFTGILVSVLSKKEPIASGIMVNISISTEGYNYLTEDYFEKLGGAENDQEVRLDYTQFENLTMATDVEANYNAAMVVIARVSGGLLDYMLLDQYAMEFYLNQDVYMDLREFFTEEELAQMQDKIVQAREEGSEETWVAAVDITDIPFVQKNISVKDGGKVYFALSGSAKDPALCRDIWNYLHEWE